MDKTDQLLKRRETERFECEQLVTNKQAGSLFYIALQVVERCLSNMSIPLSLTCRDIAKLTHHQLASILILNS